MRGGRQERGVLRQVLARECSDGSRWLEEMGYRDGDDGISRLRGLPRRVRVEIPPPALTDDVYNN